MFPGLISKRKKMTVFYPNTTSGKKR